MISFPSDDLLLENERALLRPLVPEDSKYLLSFANQEAELWKYSFVSAAGETGLNNYIREALQLKEQKKEFPFIVFDKKLNAYAGSTRFYDINLPFSSVQLGYTWYGKKFQRSGLNRNCKLLLLSYAFETWGMERVEFRADFRNKISIEAMKNIGCTEEGVLRSNMPVVIGGRRDSIVLSILKEEWFGFVKKQLQERIR